MNLLPSTSDNFYVHCFDNDIEFEASGIGGKNARITYKGEPFLDVRKIVITVETGCIPKIEIEKFAGLPRRKEGKE